MWEDSSVLISWNSAIKTLGLIIHDWEIVLILGKKGHLVPPVSQINGFNVSVYNSDRDPYILYNVR